MSEPVNQYPLRAASIIATAILSLVLSACTFDYLNNLDRMTLAGGNAVQSNLERETINPSSRRTYNKSGLGADGSVVPNKSTASSAQPPPVKSGA